jgi:hypothetical protein
VIPIFLIRPVFLAAACLLAVPALSHEFWIAPDPYQANPGDPLIAQFKNGENFIGINLGYFERRSARFEMIQDGKATPLNPRQGNLPVLEMAAPGDGLLVIAHETTPSRITYKEWEKFQAFADHKDFPDIRARHLERKLPLTDFAEGYSRHVKALIGIGLAEGQDRALGLETEFIALTNPYTDDTSTGFAVELRYLGALRTNAQIEVFARAPDGEVSVNLYRTDDKGRAVIPVQAGHEYLLDAVVLRESPDGADHVWETLWAALTFRVP